MHHFFIPPEWLHNNQVILLDPVAHQIRNVLRMEPGQYLCLLDNQGWQYKAEITAIARHQIHVTLLDQQPAANEPTITFTLYQSLLKRDNFEWVLQKGTELGVTRFVPLITQRTVARTKSNKEARWQRILTEAAEQCRRGRIPHLAAPLTFAQALNQTAACRFIAWVGDMAPPLPPFPLPLPATIHLFIGPEGGFTDDEIQQARQHYIQSFTLGPRTLRSETAAITATALLMSQLGQLK